MNGLIDSGLMLTITVLFPAIGAGLIMLFVKSKTVSSVRQFAIIIGLIELIFSAIICFGYDFEKGGLQFSHVMGPWIRVIDAKYSIGVDGLSAPLVLLTGLLTLAAIFSSISIKDRVSEYYIWIFVLQSAVMGVFVAQDLLLFFIFWELELIPMYLLISTWGSGRKQYSAMKFLIFTFGGSAFMLIGILLLYLGVGTMDIPSISSMEKLLLPVSTSIVFLLFFVGFAVKLPVWPLHTWLPDAHTDAPTGVSVILAGVLLKMGGYGLIRINVGIFPDTAMDFSGLIALLAVINILVGAFVTFRQTDLKRLIANSSVSHMGFVLLGISSIGAASTEAALVGVTGAALQMFTHGTITGLLFVCVGLIYDRAHTRHIPDFSGLAGKMPVMAIFFLLAGLASLGLPITSGFVAEIMIFLGAFQYSEILTILGTLGVFLAAGYILWNLRTVLFGPQMDRWSKLNDINVLEACAPVILSISIILIGVYPKILTDIISTGIVGILR